MTYYSPRWKPEQARHIDKTRRELRKRVSEFKRKRRKGEHDRE